MPEAKSAKELQHEDTSVKPVTQEITLSDGTICTIRQGKGKDIIKASRMVNSQEEIQPVFMSMLVEFDGKKRSAEDITELPVPDYIALIVAFEKINPLSVPSKSSS